MSVFKKDESLETRVKVLERKVKELERLVGKKKDDISPVKEEETEEELCLIS